MQEKIQRGPSPGGCLQAPNHTPPLWKMGSPRNQLEGGQTLLSSFFMVTRSRDLRECPVGVMK